jgi:hypothetical protein
VFRDDSKSFVNLSLYEQRLQRTLDKSLNQLQTLQSARRGQSRAIQQAATPAPMLEPAPGQFVFSTTGTEPRETEKEAPQVVPDTVEPSKEAPATPAVPEISGRVLPFTSPSNAESSRKFWPLPVSRNLREPLPPEAEHAA